MNAWRAAFFSALGVVTFFLLAPADLVPALLSPDPDGNEEGGALPTWMDKVGHVAAFALLGALGRRAYPSAPAWLVLVGLAAFGAATEVAQHWVPGRRMDALDAVADAGGAIVGIVLARRSARAASR